MKKQTKRERVIVEMAREQHHDEGTCEVDNNAEVSEGDDNGAYVQAWVWVSFDGTKLNKE